MESMPGLTVLMPMPSRFVTKDSMTARAVWFMCMALLLGGCMVGPDYHAPGSSAPAQFINPGAPPTTQTSVTQSKPVEMVQWWRNFNDPVLDSLISRARRSQSDRQAASPRQARANLGVVASGLFPEVDASGSYTRTGTASGGIAHHTKRRGDDAHRWKSIGFLYRGIRRDLGDGHFRRGPAKRGRARTRASPPRSKIVVMYW